VNRGPTRCCRGCRSWLCEGGRDGCAEQFEGAALGVGGGGEHVEGGVHDPADPVGRLLFTVLSMIAEFEADLPRMRTREGGSQVRHNL
jgi:hypothetical protein